MYVYPMYVGVCIHQSSSLDLYRYIGICIYIAYACIYRYRHHLICIFSAELPLRRQYVYIYIIYT